MHTVRSGRCATIGVVTKLMDVEATLSIGIISSNVPGDDGGGEFGILLEGNGALDLGVTSNGSNCGDGSTRSARRSGHGIESIRYLGEIRR